MIRAPPGRGPAGEAEAGGRGGTGSFRLRPGRREGVGAGSETEGRPGGHCRADGDQSDAFPSQSGHRR